jgi:zinc protease
MTELITIRLDNTKDENGERYRFVVAVWNDGFDDTKFIMFTLSPVGLEYKSSFEEILYQIERVKRHHFSQEELNRAKVAVSKRLDANMRRFAKPKNEDAVSTIIDHFTKGVALTDNTERTNLEIDILNEISLEEVNGNLDTFFSDKNRILFISCPESDEPNVPTAAELLEINESVQRMEILPYLYQTLQKELADFLHLKGSKIASEKLINKYNVKEFTLQNGIKVYWSYNPDKSAMVTCNVLGERGISSLKEEDIVYAKMIGAFTRSKGLGNLNYNELKTYLAQYNVAAYSNVGLFSDQITGNSSAKDVEMLLKLIYLDFTDPNFDQETFNKSVDMSKENSSNPSKSSMFRDSVVNFKFNNNPYRAPLKLTDYDKANLEKSAAIYRAIFSNANEFHFFLSGNVPDETIKSLIEKYLGSLPVDRVRNGNAHQAGALAKGVKEMVYFVDDLVTPKSEIELVYHGKMDATPWNKVSVDILRYILSNRYLNTIREEKGGTYYVRVTASLSKKPVNECVLSIDFETDPKLRDELVQIVQDEIDDIVQNGPKESELRDVLVYLKKREQDVERNSEYWFSRFKELITEGMDTKDGLDEMINTINAADIQKVAKELFNQGNKMVYIYGTR